MSARALSVPVRGSSWLTEPLDVVGGTGGCVIGGTVGGNCTTVDVVVVDESAMLDSGVVGVVGSVGGVVGSVGGVVGSVGGVVGSVGGVVGSVGGVVGSVGGVVGSVGGVVGSVGGVVGSVGGVVGSVGGVVGSVGGVVGSVGGVVGSVGGVVGSVGGVSSPLQKWAWTAAEPVAPSTSIVWLLSGDPLPRVAVPPFSRSTTTYVTGVLGTWIVFAGGLKSSS